MQRILGSRVSEPEKRKRDEKRTVHKLTNDGDLEASRCRRGTRREEGRCLRI